jgi:hypothetical protein
MSNSHDGDFEIDRFRDSLLPKRVDVRPPQFN